MSDLVTHVGSPINFAVNSRPDDELFKTGSLSAQDHIFDLGLSPRVINAIMSYKFRQSYFPYFWNMFGDRTKGVPHTEIGWREKKELMYDGLVVSSPSSTGLVVDVDVAAPEDGVTGVSDPSKNWWLESSEITTESGRNFYIVSVTESPLATASQRLTLRAFDGATITVSGGSIEDMPNGSRFGELAQVRGRTTSILTARHVDHINFRNLMTTINTYCSVDKDAARNRVLWSFDTRDGNKIDYYLTEVERDDMIRHYAQANNKLLFGQMNQNTAVDALSGAGLYQQIDPDTIESYTGGLTIEKLRKGITRWRQLNPENRIKEVIALCGTEAWADIQRLFENVQPLVRNAQGGYMPVPKDLVVGQEYTYYYWHGMYIHFREMVNFDSTYVQARRSPSNPNVSIYSHDILMLDMGYKNDIEPGSEQPDFKIQMYCPMNPDGSKDLFQAVTRTGTIDASGNAIQGRTVSFEDRVERQFISSFMMNVEDRFAVFNFTKRV